MKLSSIVVTGVVAAVSGVAAAQSPAVQWRIADGGNGHWYQRVVRGAGVSWPAARDLAQQLGGHLATVTSSAENDFIFAVAEVGSWPTRYGPWLGGYQAPNSLEPGAGWRWVTEEPWDWTRWDIFEPNNGCNDDENSLHYIRFSNRWNDLPETGWCPPNGEGPVTQLIVEWDADCNNDGVVDYGQIRAGQLQDFNSSIIPDCCEQGAPCVAGSYPVEWRFQDGGNGHWYQVTQLPVSWDGANAQAQSAGAHLATITSNTENQFIAPLAAQVGSSAVGVWGGGYRTDPQCGSGCLWIWVTNEPWNFSAWHAGEPNNQGGHEDRLEVFAYTPSEWNDLTGAELRKSLIEWDADCNNDGIVDYGQILRGDLSDINGNGIPDICEDLGEVVHVPAEYPTIQPAIDSANPLVHRIIIVAPGTYAGPIDFKGRDVVVRGAGAGQTIVQGTGGQQSSVVLFSGGEPGTAALEQVTVRDGATGTPAVGFPSALVGGGLYAYNSAASVRNCVFEHNTAGFGGGAYFQISTGQVSNCTFRDNTAAADGGGMLLSQGSILVTDTVVELNQCNSRGAGMHIVEGNSRLLRASVRDNLSHNVVGGVSWSPGVAATAFLQVEASSITGNIAVVVQGGLGVLRGGPTPRVSLLNSTACSNTPLPNVTGLWSDLGGNVICDCAGDLTLDGIVNGADLGVLLGQWGPATAATVSDINHDGLVNGADLGILLGNWGPCQN